MQVISEGREWRRASSSAINKSDLLNGPLCCPEMWMTRRTATGKLNSLPHAGEIRRPLIEIMHAMDNIHGYGRFTMGSWA